MRPLMKGIAAIFFAACIATGLYVVSTTGRHRTVDWTAELPIYYGAVEIAENTFDNIYLPNIENAYSMYGVQLTLYTAPASPDNVLNWYHAEMLGRRWSFAEGYFAENDNPFGVSLENVLAYHKDSIWVIIGIRPQENNTRLLLGHLEFPTPG